MFRWIAINGWPIGRLLLDFQSIVCWLKVDQVAMFVRCSLIEGGLAVDSHLTID